MNSTNAPAQMSESMRKSQHDALQEHLSGIQDKYANVAASHPSGAIRAQARLMQGYVGTVQQRAKASFKAGGNPAIDNHLPVITSAEGHLAKIGAAAAPAS